MNASNVQESTEAPGDAEVRDRRQPLMELQQAIQKLTWPELQLLKAWFDDNFADAWDRQIEEDALAGRLDAFGREALNEYNSGRCTPL